MVADESISEPPANDRPFYPYRRAASDRARAIVSDVTNQIQSFERYYQIRKRKRKQADQAIFEATVSALVCDLIHHHLSDSADAVTITRSNQTLGRKSRYRPPAYGKTLPDILDRLAAPEMDFVEMSMGHLGYFGPARRTTLRAGPRLISKIEDHDIGLEDLGRLDGEELIILKRSKDGHWDEAEPIEYPDTPKTRQYRDELKAINEWLDAAEIMADPIFENGHVVDDRDRRLRRYFNNGSFESGGRLFGGFWQNLKKEQRRNDIRISGEEVACLDFSQMAPRILYGLAGSAPPQVDAYELRDWKMPRDGVKKIFNALLFSEKPLDRMPKGTRRFFPPSVRVEDVVERLKTAHLSISHLFLTGVGHRVQFVESEILIDVLLDLKERGIVSLPIHDAVLVPRSSSQLVREVMERVFEDRTGIKGIVKEEGG